MITNSSNPSYRYLRKLMVLPVTALLIALVAVNCTAKNDVIQKETEVKEELKEVVVQDLPISSHKQDDIRTGSEKIIEIRLDDIKRDLKNGNDPVFQKVEIEAAFPGGQKEWLKFLQKSLNPNVPVDKGAPEGTYTVMTQFIVTKNGTVSDLKTLTHHGYGMEEEVLRVIKTTIWKPAIQNGKIVNAYRRQPVTFQIVAE